MAPTEELRGDLLVVWQDILLILMYLDQRRITEAHLQLSIAERNRRRRAAERAK